MGLKLLLNHMFVCLCSCSYDVHQYCSDVILLTAEVAAKVAEFAKVTRETLSLPSALILNCCVLTSKQLLQGNIATSDSPDLKK